MLSVPYQELQQESMRHWIELVRKYPGLVHRLAFGNICVLHVGVQPHSINLPFLLKLYDRDNVSIHVEQL